jgi:uncharacterized protein YycO
MGQIVMQFAGSSSITSRLIQWFDHGEFAHVDTVLTDGTLLGARDDVMDGCPSGVQIRSADYQQGYVLKRVTLPCTDDQQKTYYDFVMAQIGKKYDEKAIAAFAVGRDWRAPDSWFCSELCAAALEESGVVPTLSAPCNKIAPDDLLLVVSALTPISS